MLAAAHEREVRELARQLARRGQRQAERLGDLTDGGGLLVGDVREDGEVAGPEPVVAELYVEVGPAPAPEAAEDRPEQLPKLPEVSFALSNSCHMVKVIEW